MSMLRGIFLDNLGLKLVALLLALMVYLNVYTERPATMTITFPIQIADLPDSLSLSGPVPSTLQVQLRGRAKQLIRLRVTEPPIRISLAGVQPGRYERALGVEDLPLPPGVEVEVDRMLSPRVIELQVDRVLERSVPVAARVEGEPANGAFWPGTLHVRPPRVTVRGPATAVEALDSVRVRTVSIAGRRDTVFASVPPEALPDWCTATPDRVEIMVPLEPGITRRMVVPVDAERGGRRYAVTPERVVAVVSAPRRLVPRLSLSIGATWSLSDQWDPERGGKVALEVRGSLPDGVRVRFDPDSVRVRPLAS